VTDPRTPSKYVMQCQSDDSQHFRYMLPEQVALMHERSGEDELPEVLCGCVPLLMNDAVRYRVVGNVRELYAFSLMLVEYEPQWMYQLCVPRPYVEQRRREQAIRMVDMVRRREESIMNRRPTENQTGLVSVFREDPGRHTSRRLVRSRYYTSFGSNSSCHVVDFVDMCSYVFDTRKTYKCISDFLSGGVCATGGAASRELRVQNTDLRNRLLRFASSEGIATLAPPETCYPLAHLHRILECVSDTLVYVPGPRLKQQGVDLMESQRLAVKWAHYVEQVYCKRVRTSRMMPTDFVSTGSRPQWCHPIPGSIGVDQEELSEDVHSIACVRPMVMEDGACQIGVSQISRLCPVMQIPESQSNVVWAFYSPPTGAGKTLGSLAIACSIGPPSANAPTAIEAAAQNDKGRRSIFFVPRELIDQWRGEMDKWMVPGSYVVILSRDDMNRHQTSIQSGKIVLCCIQKWRADTVKCLMVLAAPDRVFIDEAHSAVPSSKQLQRILFDTMDRRLYVVYLITATPFALDRERLLNAYLKSDPAAAPRVSMHARLGTPELLYYGLVFRPRVRELTSDRSLHVQITNYGLDSEGERQIVADLSRLISCRGIGLRPPELCRAFELVRRCSGGGIMYPQAVRTLVDVYVQRCRDRRASEMLQERVVVPAAAAGAGGDDPAFEESDMTGHLNGQCLRRLLACLTSDANGAHRVGLHGPMTAPPCATVGWEPGSGEGLCECPVCYANMSPLVWCADDEARAARLGTFSVRLNQSSMGVASPIEACLQLCCGHVLCLRCMLRVRAQRNHREFACPLCRAPVKDVYMQVQAVITTVVEERPLDWEEEDGDSSSTLLNMMLSERRSRCDDIDETMEKEKEDEEDEEQEHCDKDGGEDGEPRATKRSRVEVGDDVDAELEERVGGDDGQNGGVFMSSLTNCFAAYFTEWLQYPPMSENGRRRRLVIFFDYPSAAVCVRKCMLRTGMPASSIVVANVGQHQRVYEFRQGRGDVLLCAWEHCTGHDLGDAGHMCILNPDARSSETQQAIGRVFRVSSDTDQPVRVRVFLDTFIGRLLWYQKEWISKKNGTNAMVLMSFWNLALTQPGTTPDVMLRVVSAACGIARELLRVQVKCNNNSARTHVRISSPTRVAVVLAQLSFLTMVGETELCQSAYSAGGIDFFPTEGVSARAVETVRRLVVVSDSRDQDLNKGPGVPHYATLDDPLLIPSDV